MLAFVATLGLSIALLSQLPQDEERAYNLTLAAAAADSDALFEQLASAHRLQNRQRDDAVIPVRLESDTDTEIRAAFIRAAREGGFEPSGQGDLPALTIADDALISEQLVDGDTDRHRAGVADSVLGVFDQFAQQARAVFDAAAVFVAALIESRRPSWRDR